MCCFVSSASLVWGLRFCRRNRKQTISGMKAWSCCYVVLLLERDLSTLCDPSLWRGQSHQDTLYNQQNLLSGGHFVSSMISIAEHCRESVVLLLVTSYCDIKWLGWILHVKSTLTKAVEFCSALVLPNGCTAANLLQEVRTLMPATPLNFTQNWSSLVVLFDDTNGSACSEWYFCWSCSHFI